MENPLLKHGRFFDVWSRYYRANLFGRQLQRMQLKAIERLRVVKGQTVLDLGCGPADGAARINAAGALGIGLDYSEGMLKNASADPQLSGRLLRGDAGQLPFRDAAFDKVLCTNSFHHYPNHRAALREMHRVLKPGGLLVLVDPRKDNLFGRLAIDGFENRVFGLKEVRIFTCEEWPVLLRDAGFSSATVTPGSLIDPFSWAEVMIEAVA